MIHPNTEVRFVNPSMGYGVFATSDIPRGTIMYVRDRLESELAGKRSEKPGQPEDAMTGKDSFSDENGVHIVSWDNAKYVNHRCDCNTMATGYGFAIAIRDIWKGQEISEEYGLFNLDRVIPLACGCTQCRKSLRPDDLEKYHARWDELIISALKKIPDVSQPLMKHMDAEVKKNLRAYLCDEEPYTSVLELRYHRKPLPASLVPPDITQPSSHGFNG
ncbi:MULTISPECIES: SET domain-containing protein-lysine N-methyltransferase [unclassified Pseudodesulfovibrio]|uniref:SET domain-containing protein n=1 Tax=unclassified Pseudodesulfovibrio TaxID=2661612 RepID=UPI000FEB9798|nr:MULTISPECIES: SET domain-containing protein-lysine N-methyltransferase [unclassified Pseudodesulfovibrio]MCJ2164559.1 SET domain-containing protein-lysine N-methyltransferase [Pseudodesulfovibrio sp. S3-i]RWU04757.1 SET domain-containing protein [Pseudodesulfovibrio sp. S3]